MDNTTPFLPLMFDMIAMGVPEKTSLYWHNTIHLLKSHAEHMADCIERPTKDNEDLLNSVSHFREAMELISLTHTVKMSAPNAVGYDLYLPTYHDMLEMGAPEEAAARWSNAITLLKRHAEYMAQCIAEQTGDKEVLREAAKNFREMMKVVRPDKQ